ncbi:MAG: recombinase family protein [Streptosporangiales bacterium]|nr:recombinase family protein [Streptosporangiales bacterium]
MRVAIYIRISTDESHQPYSLEAQEHKLRAYIASQDGWHLVAVFPDEASGASTDRPELRKALAAARAGRFDLLLVYRVDRFARSVRGLSQLLEELDQAGVAFRSATEPFDTATPAGRMMVQMLAVFAEFERATIIDRVINGMERKAARGEWCGGSRPYGYDIHPDTGHLVVRDDEAPAVRIIFRLYARKRLGAKAVANELNRRGYRTKNGRPWSRDAALTVLRNRVYLGEVYFRDHYYPGPHNPLIDRETFMLAQEILIARGDEHSKRAANSSDYLLAGKVTCARCGKRYVGVTATGNRYTYRYYICFSRHRYGAQTCPAERLPADQLDAGVLDALLHTYQDTGLFEKAVAAAKQRTDALRDNHTGELQAVEHDLATVEAAIERYLRAFEAGTMPEHTCGARVRELADRAAKLRDRKAELRELLDADQASTPTAEELAAVRRRIRDVLHNGSMPTKKALIHQLVHEVNVTGRHHVQPVFRLPYRPEDQKVRTMSGSARPGGFEPPAF